MGTNHSAVNDKDQIDEYCFAACSTRLKLCGVAPVVEHLLSLQKSRERRIAVVIGENSLYARCPVTWAASQAVRVTNQADCATEELDPVKLSSPLHELCKNNLHILELLLQHLPKTNELYWQNSKTHEYLDECEYGRVAEILSSFKDAVHILDSNNDTPLDCLIKSICVKDVCMKQWVPVLSVLLASGAQLNELDGDRSNLYQIFQLTAKLLEKKTCTDSCEQLFLQALWAYDSDFIQSKSLEIAISSQNPMLVKLLLTNKGIYVQQLVEYENTGENTAESCTPMIYALKKCEIFGESRAIIEIIGILAMHYGVDIKAPFFAAERGYTKIFSRLIAHPNSEFTGHTALEELLQTSGLYKALHLLRGVMESESKALHKAKSIHPRVPSSRAKTRKWRSRIEQSYHSLVYDLEPDGEFLDWLVQKGVFRIDLAEIIRAKSTTRQKTRELLLRAQSITKDKQEHFCWALRQSGQEHLAELLEDDNNTDEYCRVYGGYSNIKSIKSNGESEIYYGYSSYQTPKNHTTYLTVGEGVPDTDESIYENL